MTPSPRQEPQSPRRRHFPHRFQSDARPALAGEATVAYNPGNRQDSHGALAPASLRRTRCRSDDVQGRALPTRFLDDDGGLAGRSRGGRSPPGAFLVLRDRSRVGPRVRAPGRRRMRHAVRRLRLLRPGVALASGRGGFAVDVRRLGPDPRRRRLGVLPPSRTPRGLVDRDGRAPSRPSLPGSRDALAALALPALFNVSLCEPPRLASIPPRRASPEARPRSGRSPRARNPTRRIAFGRADDSISHRLPRPISLPVTPISLTGEASRRHLTLIQPSTRHGFPIREGDSKHDSRFLVLHVGPGRQFHPGRLGSRDPRRRPQVLLRLQGGVLQGQG